MKRVELIAAFRVAANDRAEPYLCSDRDVIGWLEEAQREAAIRARLIRAVGDDAVCRIVARAGTAAYDLHPTLFELQHVAFMPDGGHPIEIDLMSAEALDRIRPGWRYMRAGVPEFAVQSDTRLQLVPTPLDGGAILLEGYRLPKAGLPDDEAEPEIHTAHHRQLVEWALHRAFSVPDAEMFDPERAIRAEQAFSRYFGERPDCDLRRDTRADLPHHNQAHFV